jgi:Bacterial regulatory proteins, luxR family
LPTDPPAAANSLADGGVVSPRASVRDDTGTFGRADLFQLDMQESTVKVHVRNILKKLNAANRTHAAFVANQLLGKNAEPVALPTRFG